MKLWMAAGLVLFLASSLEGGSIGAEQPAQPARTAGLDTITGSALTKTVTLAATMPDGTYHVSLMSVTEGATPSFQVGGLTTTTFRVTVSANTDTVTFTYEARDY